MDKNQKINIRRILAIIFVIIYLSFSIYIISSAGRTNYLGGLYQKSCGEFASTEEGEIKINSNKDIMCPIINPLVEVGEVFGEILGWFPIIFVFGIVIIPIVMYIIGYFLFKLILNIPSKILITITTIAIILIPAIIVVSLITQNPCKDFRGSEISYCLKGAYAAYDGYYMQIALHNFYNVDPQYVIANGKSQTAYDTLKNIENACNKIVFEERKNHCYEYRDSFAKQINN